MVSLDNKFPPRVEAETELSTAGFVFFIAAAVVFLGGGLLVVASIVL